MSYAIKKVRNQDLYYVINKKTGKKFSAKPLSKEMAEKQLKELYAKIFILKLITSRAATA